MTNIMDVWECAVLDVKAYAKYNDKHKFSKFQHMIPLKTKRGPSVVSRFGPYSMTLIIQVGALYGYALKRARNL